MIPVQRHLLVSVPHQRDSCASVFGRARAEALTMDLERRDPGTTQRTPGNDEPRRPSRLSTLFPRVLGLSFPVIRLSRNCATSFSNFGRRRPGCLRSPSQRMCWASPCLPVRQPAGLECTSCHPVQRLWKMRSLQQHTQLPICVGKQTRKVTAASGGE